MSVQQKRAEAQGLFAYARRVLVARRGAGRRARRSRRHPLRHRPRACVRRAAAAPPPASFTESAARAVADRRRHAGCHQLDPLLSDRGARSDRRSARPSRRHQTRHDRRPLRGTAPAHRYGRRRRDVRRRQSDRRRPRRHRTGHARRRPAAPRDRPHHTGRRRTRPVAQSAVGAVRLERRNRSQPA